MKEKRGAWMHDALSKLVSAGTITQAQADSVSAALEAARPEGGPGQGRGGPGLAVAAKALGIDASDLRTALQSGKTIAEVAKPGSRRDLEHVRPQRVATISEYSEPMTAGTLQQISRFPVKSMLGESPPRATLETSGFTGDRTHMLFDRESGKVASAKDPRTWAQLLGFRAVHAGEPGPGAALVITLPDGSVVRSDDPAVDQRLSAATGRDVQLRTEPVGDAGYDYVWDVEDLAPEAVVTGTQTGTTADGKAISTMPLALMAPGTFQDVAPVTVLTTAALAAMSALHPHGDWDPARFRANLLLDVAGEEIVENGWQGRQLSVGDVVLEVTSPSPRCVMTTLPQLDLPRDREILRTVARHNQQEFAGLGRWACLGVYAGVVTPGVVSVGDPVTLL